MKTEFERIKGLAETVLSHTGDPMASVLLTKIIAICDEQDCCCSVCGRSAMVCVNGSYFCDEHRETKEPKPTLEDRVRELEKRVEAQSEEFERLLDELDPILESRNPPKVKADTTKPREPFTRQQAYNLLGRYIAEVQTSESNNTVLTRLFDEIIARMTTETKP